MRETNYTTNRRAARMRARRRRRLTVVIATTAVVLLAIGGGVVWAVKGATPTAEPKHTKPAASEPTPEPAPAPPPAPVYDVDSPASITVVVNKQRPLNPIDWEPEDLVETEGIPNVWGHPLRAEAEQWLQQMYAASGDAGVPFTITSGYRSYDLQKEIYDDLVAAGGVEYADRDTARPGYSEHQTGLTVDLYGNEGCQLAECFGETATGIWLRDNAWRFGYILRYHDGEQATVGYTYEPWHFRYVGVDVATAMHDRGLLNLEDFFGLPPAPTN